MFFKNNSSSAKNNFLIKSCALLIHAAKIDENYTEKEEEIIKKNEKIDKYMIIEQLWKIIISDNNSDQYESNLMRRICGLIYFPDKLSGEIKLKLKKK